MSHLKGTVETVDAAGDDVMPDQSAVRLANEDEPSAQSRERTTDRDAVQVANGANESNGNAVSATESASANGNPSLGADENDMLVDGEKSTRSKKKARLHWDEENLTLNALEMERTPRMKIDEPNTPYHGSEASSSTSSSAPHSPASPAVTFIPAERLQGFQSLEDGMGVPNGNGHSSGSSGGNTRTVQIVEDVSRSNGSSPRSSRDFAAKRKRHYQNEARLSNFASSDSSRSPRESPSVEVQHTNIESSVTTTANGAANENGVSQAATGKMEDGN